jgi:phosphotransferase system IIB component
MFHWWEEMISIIVQHGQRNVTTETNCASKLRGRVKNEGNSLMFQQDGVLLVDYQIRQFRIMGNKSGLNVN